MGHAGRDERGLDAPAAVGSGDTAGKEEPGAAVDEEAAAPGGSTVIPRKDRDGRAWVRGDEPGDRPREESRTTTQPKARGADADERGGIYPGKPLHAHAAPPPVGRRHAHAPDEPG